MTDIGFFRENDGPCRAHASKGGDCVILVIDDDPAMRTLLSDELSEEGCHVAEAGDGNHAWDQLKFFAPDLIITDFRMPYGGFEFLASLRIAVPETPIILVTAFGDSFTKAMAIERGVNMYLDKPVRMAELKAAMSQVCKISQCRNANIMPSRGTPHER